MYELILVVAAIILLLLNGKEHFLIETVKDNKDRLTDRLSIDETLTTKYTQGISEDMYKTKSKIVSYNDDIEYKNKVIKSKNVEIDRNIMNILQNINNVIIDTNLEKIDMKVNLEIDDTEVRDVEFINNKEVEYIVSKFIEYINKNTTYEFSSLEIGKTYLSLLSDKNSELIKKYKVSLFIFENTITYTKRLVLNFITKQYYNKKGVVILENVEIPKDATLDTKPLLPPATNPIILNTISKSDNYYTINNKITTGVLLTQEDKEIEKKRQAKVKQLRRQYSCFGIPESELINDQEQCLNFGGVWDRPVQEHRLCPFYNSNKNYINNRGGVKGDYCEMPSGIQIIGFSQYEKDPSKSRPLCYNCKTDLIGQGSLGHCCDKQKSPDYKYPGDKLDRYNNRFELLSKGLSVD